jgi:hypothetical protein
MEATEQVGKGMSTPVFFLPYVSLGCPSTSSLSTHFHTLVPSKALGWTPGYTQKGHHGVSPAGDSIQILLVWPPVEWPSLS